MAEDQQAQQGERPKRSYKPRTPDLERVVEAIKAGEYDEDIFQIRDAFQARLEHKQQQVLNLVREAFGEEAEIMMRKTTVEDATQTPPMPKGMQPAARPNPFVAKAKPTAEGDLDALADAEILPGPYKVHPGNGNSYRRDTSVESPEGIVMITDVHGGHQIGISEDEWNSWPDESGRAEPSPGATTVVEQSDSERRGAMIGGLHPSDIAE